MSGEVEPDTYIVAKETLTLLDIRLGHQAFKIVRGPDGHDKNVDLDDEHADARVLDDDELRRIAELAVATERHNGCPQDTEWAIAAGRRTWCRHGRSRRCAIRPHRRPTSTRCWPAGWPRRPGRRRGKVRVLETPDEGDRLPKGEILVAPMTNPDWLPTIRGPRRWSPTAAA